MIGIEPRKKYALVHEDIGIFIIGEWRTLFLYLFFYAINSGGYNLFVDVPIQKEPDTDYLFKFDGNIVKIPPLKPCRANFGEWFSKINLYKFIQKIFFFGNILAIYADSDEIYVAGGQTIDNE
jgi:hypothetical protein